MSKVQCLYRKHNPPFWIITLYLFTALRSRPLDGWTYKNENAVFYHPPGAPMSDQEKIDFSKKQKQIVRANTRFKSNPWKVSEAQKGNLMASKKESELGKVGIDGNDKLCKGVQWPNAGVVPVPRAIGSFTNRNILTSFFKIGGTGFRRNPSVRPRDAFT